MKRTFFFLYISLCCQFLMAQSIPNRYAVFESDGDSCVHKITRSLKSSKKKTLSLYFGESVSSHLFRENEIPEIKEKIKSQLPTSIQNYQLTIYAKNRQIETLIPNKERINHSTDKNRFLKKQKCEYFCTNLSDPFRTYNQGLSCKNIALWSSHGWYYEETTHSWTWQRARLFGQVEDLLTASYVNPYIIPMLENAGAAVFTPKERSLQRNEIIIDNDISTSKTNVTSIGNWKNEKGGFFYKDSYVFQENPFELGNYIFIEKPNDTDSLIYSAELPEKGEYPVYISFKTVKNSTTSAIYNIKHAEGNTLFRVNQTMSGSTWVYLGTFLFDKTIQICIYSDTNGDKKTITSDAIRIGGGIGNIYPNDKDEDFSEPSERPRYTEAAKYWLQFAGMPDSVYYCKTEENEYRNDIYSRGKWVNYLMQPVTPKKNEPKGLGVPLDLCMALHTDAGIKTDKIIGPMAICMTKSDNKDNYTSGVSRLISRDFADLMLTQITTDLQKIYGEKWQHRGIVDQSYVEAREPEIPTVLLELLSHQNPEDVRYANDPTFKFNTSRAIYKTILKFLAYQYNYEYVVAPLPVSHFSAIIQNDSIATLSWKPTIDSLEITAKADRFYICKKNMMSNQKTWYSTNDSIINIPITQDSIFNFYVIAENNGGRSFPSEILSLCKRKKASQTVIIVNAFDRISAPDFIKNEQICGYNYEIDHGMPDKLDFSFTGDQYEYDWNKPFINNNNPGFGASKSNKETQIFAGNTFNYPYIHGKSIFNSGYSFVSCSDEAIEDGYIKLSDYPIADIIYGAERTIENTDFGIYSDKMKEKIQDFCKNNRSIMISGSFVGSDLNQNEKFAQNTLKYKFNSQKACSTGNVSKVKKTIFYDKEDLDFYTQLNEKMYAAESVDEIVSTDKNAKTVLRYSENNFSAATYYNGNYKCLILGFPFETIINESKRDNLMKCFLDATNRK